MSKKKNKKSKKPVNTKSAPKVQEKSTNVDAKPTNIDEHAVYLRVLEEYNELKKKRESYRKYGPLFVIITGVLFLTLMFSLESKIQFLLLWVVTDFYCAALMIRSEYRYNQFMGFLGLTEEDQNEKQYIKEDQNEK